MNNNNKVKIVIKTKKAAEEVFNWLADAHEFANVRKKIVKKYIKNPN